MGGIVPPDDTSWWAIGAGTKGRDANRSIEVVDPEDVLGIGLGSDILVVDDDPATLVAYEAALAPLGRTLVLARSGPEALARLLDRDFALVLLDVAMPEMTGIEVARIARQRPRNRGMPIVFITGEESWGEVIVEAYAVGAFDFVLKPILPEVLRAKVNVYLTLQDRTRELLQKAQRLARAQQQISANELALRDRRASSVEAESTRKDQYLALLGHELRNPLAAMVSALELYKLRGGELPEELAIVDRHMMHLAQLANDLLDASRLQHDAISLHRQAVDVGRALSEALDQARPTLARHEHELSIRVPAGLLVDADHARLVQVLANLITNAARYTPGEGHIDVAVAREPDRVRITVSDDGIGIPEELLPQVFDMFVRGGASADRADGGLGLGLAIVRSIVELHGGTVTAASAGVGKGATFTVLWPLASSQTPTAKSPALRLDSMIVPLRILVVDDNEDAAVLLGEILRELGHDVSVVHHAPGALAMAASLIPDVAFLDIGLPGTSGLELARRLRALPGWDTTVLVALTGYGQREDRARSREAGFAHHFVKPLDIKTLTRLLAEVASQK